MPRKFLKRHLPSPGKLKGHSSLKFLGERIHEPNLWHLNRRSVSSAFFVGIFCAMLPIPFQMLAAASLAVLLRCNLPISVALVWITNPLTMPAIFYFSYKVGSFLLGNPLQDVDFELSLDSLGAQLTAIWQPLLLGSLISGAVFGACCYIMINLYWRWVVSRNWLQRKKRRQENSSKE